MSNRNRGLRDYARKNGVFLWEIAERYGMQDSNFSKRLRQELPDEERRRLMALVDEIALDKRQGVE